MFKRFGAGVAVGYVLGARAGHKRYEEITKLAERAMEFPAVERLVTSGRDLASDQGQRLLGSLRDRMQGIGAYDDEAGGGRSGRRAGREEDEEDDEDDDVDDELDDEDDEEDEDEEEDFDDDAGADEAARDEDEDVEDEDVEDGAEEDESDEEVSDETEAEPRRRSAGGARRNGGQGDRGTRRGSDGDGGGRQGRSRRGIGSVAAAARERGRVD